MSDSDKPVPGAMPSTAVTDLPQDPPPADPPPADPLAADPPDDLAKPDLAPATAPLPQTAPEDHAPDLRSDPIAPPQTSEPPPHAPHPRRGGGIAGPILGGAIAAALGFVAALPASWFVARQIIG